VKRVVLAAVVLALVPASAPAKPAPARLLVESREFNFVLSRSSVKAGDAIVQLANRGEDPHDLRLKRVGGRGGGTVAETLPGEVGEWEGRLRRGRYRLWCTLEGHRALGMRAVLRVR
jgi:plastocyanin